MAPLPLKLKPITAYIRRAEEFDRVRDGGQTKVIAYYCREYAAEQGVKLSEDCDDPEVAEFLGNLIGQLELDKEKLNKESDFTREDAARIFSNFANNIFTQADEEDRAGLADKDTAMQFYVAGNIYDVMQQFGELDDEIAKKKKFAKFKASDIISSIRQGLKPTPGGPGEDLKTGMPMGDSNNDHHQPTENAEFSLPDVTALPVPTVLDLGNNHPVSSTIPTSPQIEPIVPREEQKVESPTPIFREITPPEKKETPVYIPAAPVVYRPPMEVVSSPASSAGGNASKAQREDAIECCKFAIAALQYKDVDLAVQRLHDALDVLGRK